LLVAILVRKQPQILRLAALAQDDSSGWMTALNGSGELRGGVATPLCGASRGCCMQCLFFFFLHGALGVGQDLVGH